MELIIQKAKQGDKQAFEELIRAQMDYLYKVAYTYVKNDEDAADAIQETILTCYQKLCTLKKNKYFKTWMTRILINNCNNIIRSRKVVYLEDEKTEIAKWQDFSGIEWKETLQLLPEDARIAVILYYVEGFKIKEISQILDVKESTIQSRLQRARERIAREYIVTFSKGERSYE